MIPCPSCQQSVEIEDKHLGTLFTCPHCNAVYFIDWNGQPEMATHEPEAEFVPPMANDFPQDMGVPEQNNTYFEPPIAEADPSQTNSESFQQDFQPQFQAEPYQEPYQEPSGESSQEMPQESYAPPEEAAYDFNQPLDQAPSVVAPEPESFSDVTEFANSNSNLGPLSYTVVIEGIESSHLVKQLKEAMTDSRFGWETANLLAQIGQGRLVLPGLSPAKASVLINRIKYLPLKISWRQDVLASN